MHVWVVERFDGQWRPYPGSYRLRRTARAYAATFRKQNPQIDVRVRKYVRV